MRMTGIDLYEAMGEIEDSYLEEALSEAALPGADGKDQELRTGRKKKRWGDVLFGSVRRGAASVAAALLLAFVGVVNLFPTVAFAMSDVVVLGDLARAVTFDPSMRACLENEYAQYVGKEMVSKEGYHSKVYYMVVDASRISIFYKSDVMSWKDLDDVDEDVIVQGADVFGADGTELNCAVSFLQTDIKHLYELRMDFIGDESIPDEIQFQVVYEKLEFAGVETDPFDGDEVQDYDYVTVDEVVCSLYPQEQYRTVVTHHEIGQTVEIDGQKLHLDALDIYPTQARLSMTPDARNSATLTEIDIVLLDDQGREYRDKRNGMPGTWGDDGITARMYESSYFVETESITIVIKAASWLPKDKERGTISYEHRNVENLPENTTIEEMKLNDDHSLTLQIKAPLVTDDTGAYFSSIPGTVYEIGTGETVLERNGFTCVTMPLETMDPQGEDYYLCVFEIPDYEEGRYEMYWNYGSPVKLEEPIEITVE